MFDPKQRPRLFKDYLADLDKIDLSLPDEIEMVDALQALEAVPDKDERFPYLETLAKILYYSAGITKTFSKHGREWQFRAASCTGALYHIELYVITARLPGIDAGIYHYDPEANALEILRQGDYRKLIVEASGTTSHLEDAPLIIAYTTNFWRNAYKYKARAYRHAFWDSGTIISQTLAMASAFDLSATVVTGFVDTEVGKVLGLDLDEELPLALLPIGYTSYSGLKEAPELEPTTFQTKEHELQREFPAIVDMHRASSLTSVDEVEQWQQVDLDLSLPEQTDPIQLRPDSTRKMETAPLEKVIRKRGSARTFSHEQIGQKQLANLLKMGTQPFEADFYEEFGTIYNRVYITVHAVEDLQMASYRFYPGDNQLEPLQYGYHRHTSKEMGLGQDLANDAAVVIVFIADLEALLDEFGNRGYRVAQLEASILAGKMYLAAEAQGLGATGLTFKDDQVTTFFDEEDKIATFMICIGHRA